MPYGSGQRLGESINPAHMQVDYSGYERAGATAGNMLANMGQQIGGIMKKYGDDEKTIKKAEQMAKSIRDAIPELAEMGNNALTELSNPDLSQRDRLAIAEGIQDSLKLGILGLERKDGDREFDFRERQFAAKLGMDQRALEASGANQPTIMDANQLQEQISSGAKVKYVPLGNGMYQVEGATANETPLIGGVYTDENGQIRQAPSGGGNIRIPGAGGIPNALSQGQGGNFLNDRLPDPLKPFAGAFVEAGKKYNVDPNILAAISMHETGGGTSSAFRNKNNLMGVSNEDGPIQMESGEASIDKMARLIGLGINENRGLYAGVKSIEDIGRIYAPIGAGNDPTSLNQHWSGGVTSHLQRLTQNQQEAQQGQQAKQLVPNVPVPKDDVWRMDRDGLRAGQVEGSTNEIDYKTKQANLLKTQAELAKANAEAATIDEKKELLEAGKSNFSSYISEMVDAYAGLSKSGGAVQVGSGPVAYFANTELGQSAGRMMGSSDQVFRDTINGMAPNVINVIRQQSEMGAKGLDSEKELKFYVGALGDPKRPVEANIKALDILDKQYGDGTAVDNRLKNDPQLKARVDKFNFKKNEWDSRGDSATVPSNPLSLEPDLESEIDAFLNQ